MGLLRSLAKKVVGAAKAVHDEANHPGRPPSHKAADNPFHDAPGEQQAHEAAKAAARGAATGEAPPPDGAGARTGQPWYLDGETEGWDETDPT